MQPIQTTAESFTPEALHVSPEIITQALEWYGHIDRLIEVTSVPLLELYDLERRLGEPTYEEYARSKGAARAVVSALIQVAQSRPVGAQPLNDLWRYYDRDIDFADIDVRRVRGPVHRASNRSYGYAALIDRLEGYRDACHALGAQLAVRVTLHDGTVFEGVLS